MYGIASPVLSLELAGLHLRHETRTRVADLDGGVFGQKMRPFHRDLLLIGPRPAELTLSANQKPCRIAVDEQLRNRARGKPLRIRLHNLNHVLGTTLDRQLSRPLERRCACGSGISIVAPVHLDSVLRESSKRQQELDEEVLLQDEIFALRRPLRLEEFPSRLGPLVPGKEWPDDALHVYERFDPIG